MLNEPALECLATTEVIGQYKDMVYSIALTHTRNRHDAEDVFQEVFLTYHRKSPVFADPERRKAWLITTTLNCAKQNTMSSWRRKVVPIREDIVDETPGDDLVGHDFRFRTDEQDQLFRALRELPEKYRTVLHLFYFEDLSIADMATILNIETGTIRVQLSRARASMREKLKGDHFDE
ncbi:MAG TPA: RNA polymerase subunit sigma-24 [Coriobacteriia bacterium]|nr:RNA polymerase subunit sigma-24 [Coriobacteriia bacterium]